MYPVNIGEEAGNSRTGPIFLESYNCLRRDTLPAGNKSIMFLRLIIQGTALTSESEKCQTVDPQGSPCRRCPLSSPDIAVPRSTVA
ncbi:hypothetical protein J6590_076644 [Homalodisca vitripennis]|nr:hypothetical protein J6590_076644 [Homalodisca vitripennis]